MSNEYNNQKNNPYLTEIEKTLPRILALIDIDETNKTYGLLDRLYWAWKLNDFANATSQGVVNGFARLWVNGLWPYKTKENDFLKRIDIIINAASHITRKNGSLEEAFPNEGSYCVTALIAYDVLVTIELLYKIVPDELIIKWLDITEPWIKYLIKYDEEHALISNHLATASAALYRWSKFAVGRRNRNNALSKAESLLNRILINQNKEEGWYKEYEGADPGYQSLCTYYMADILEFLTQNIEINCSSNILLSLSHSIKSSLEFLQYAVHPDGSFGGIYGSRNTRIYCPGGIEQLSKRFNTAKAISKKMSSSISRMQVVTLSTIDFGNLSPMFNNYCLAATIFDKSQKSSIEELNICEKLPCETGKNFLKKFPATGMIIDSSKNHYTIISLAKGGVVMHFVNNKIRYINSGVKAFIKNNHCISTQAWNINNECYTRDNYLIIKSQFTSLNKSYPSPFKFLILRLLCTTLFKIDFIKELFKQLMVGMLITNKKKHPIYNERYIYLGEKINIKDKQYGKHQLSYINNEDNFISIHMATQGYWQIQDEES